MEEKDKNELLTRLDERMAFVQNKVIRIEEAVFGNGKPGMRNEINSLHTEMGEIYKRVDAVESFGGSCPILEVKEVLENIQERHAGEDEEKRKILERKDKETAEFIKFRWALLVSIATTLVSLAADFIR